MKLHRRTLGRKIFRHNGRYVDRGPLRSVDILVQRCNRKVTNWKNRNTFCSPYLDGQIILLMLAPSCYLKWCTGAEPSLPKSRSCPKANECMTTRHSLSGRCNVHCWTPIPGFWLLRIFQHNPVYAYPLSPEVKPLPLAKNTAFSVLLAPPFLASFSCLRILRYIKLALCPAPGYATEFFMWKIQLNKHLFIAAFAFFSVKSTNIVWRWVY